MARVQLHLPFHGRAAVACGILARRLAHGLACFGRVGGLHDGGAPWEHSQMLQIPDMPWDTSETGGAGKQGNPAGVWGRHILAQWSSVPQCAGRTS